MNGGPPNGALPEIAARIRRETGIVIKGGQLARLAAIVGRVAPDEGTARFLMHLRDRVLGPPLLDLLIEEVTVQETYFFREERELRAVDWKALSSDARARGEAVRVWVPACASGEEAYTIAMLALEAVGAQSPPMVLATDLAPSAVEVALAGNYTARSVGGVPAEMLESHFRADGGRYSILEPIKGMVRFSRHNLVADPFPPLGEKPFDLICCRNLLIYFDNETVLRVTASLESALRPHGELILGAADRLSVTTANLAGTSSGEEAGAHRRPKAIQPKLRRPLGLPEVGPVASEAEGSPPPSGAVPEGPEAGIEAALAAADSGELERAIAIAIAILAADPLDADACFIRGVAELGLDDAAAAVSSLRRCLYCDPAFGLAAFELGRAHDAGGDQLAARSAYGRALRTLDPADDSRRAITDHVDRSEVADACRLRLDSAQVFESREASGTRRSP